MLTLYRILLFTLLILFFSNFISVKLCAQSYYTLTGANAGYSSFNGNYYKESYQILSRPVYKHGGANYFIYFNQTFGNAWFIDDNTTGYPSAFYRYSNDSYPPEGLYEIDYAGDSDEPTLTKITNALITFTNGSIYTPVIVKGSINQVFGRFQLHGNEEGAQLTMASIRVDGTRSGLSNFKLWESADATFNAGSDTQLGATIAADPGDGSTLTFSSFSSSIGTESLYYFLTANVTANAEGLLQAIIVTNANLTISSGTLSGSINNEPLSNGDVSLPVQLSSFLAQINGNTIILKWSTESESNNVGFILERSVKDFKWQQLASYLTHNELKSRGNSSVTTFYTFIDNNVKTGNVYHYCLSAINTAGLVTRHSSITVNLGLIPKSTELFNAYPNPFNSETRISYQLPVQIHVTISVYDLLGRRIKILVDAQQNAGVHYVTWEGSDELGITAASSTYIIRLETDDTVLMQKVLFIK